MNSKKRIIYFHQSLPGYHLESELIMKVSHVINTLNRGGAETHLLDLIKEQIKRNYEVDLIVIGPDNAGIISLENEFINLGLSVKRLNGPRMFNLRSYFKLYRLIKKNRYEVIHSHQPRSDFMIYLMKKLSGNFKWIVSVHGKYDTYLESTNFANTIRKKFMISLANYWERSDEMIAISDSVRQWVMKLNSGLDPIVIPYWIDQTNLDSNFSIKEDISIGFLGRINKNKGIEDLLYVFNNLDTENTQLMIGGHADEQYLKYLNTIPLESKKEKIRYLGYVENRKLFFDEIDIFIFPSFSEGLGLVLLEAMSFSKLCITRDIPPMNTYLNLESGYLFTDTNTMLQSLEDAIYDLRHDKDKIKSKLFNIEEVVKKSSVISIFPLLEQVYNNE